MTTPKLLTHIGACLALAAIPFSASAVTIDFETFTGPSLFVNVVTSPQTLNINTGVGGNVKVEGGVILTKTANLPADQTSIYGTASSGSGLSNPLTITFDHNINNFFFDVLNGLTTTADFTLMDNLGNSSVFSLAPNLSSGVTTIGFATAGSVITITQTPQSGSFDFFVDNIHFDEALPPSLSVPDAGSSAMLLSLGLFGIGAVRRRVRK